MPGGVGAITQEEWVAERGLAPTTVDHDFLPCGEYVEALTTVPGQCMQHVPHVWVSLVECVGILLDIPPLTHPEWEQTYAIRARSRYYPTMELLRLHNATTLARIAVSTSMRPAQHAEMTPFFCELRERPDRNGGDLLSVEYVRDVCGAAAERLCAHVESVLFQDLEAKTSVLRCRYYEEKARENRSLAVIQDRLVELQQADLELGEVERLLVPRRCTQDAASHSLGDVVLRIGETDALPEDGDFPLNTMLGSDWRQELHRYVRRLDIPHFVAIAVLQLVAAVSLRVEVAVEEEEDTAAAPTPLSTRRAAGRTRSRVSSARSLTDVTSTVGTGAGGGGVTDADRQYWGSLDGLDGEALILKLPPFEKDPDATLADLVDRVLTPEGAIHPAIIAYRPTFEDLQLKHAVVHRAIASWKAAVHPLLLDWEARKWEAGNGLATLMEGHYGYSHIHLIKPWKWVGAVLDQWDDLRRHAVAVERQEEAQRCYDEAAAARHKRPVAPPNELAPKGEDDVEMHITEAFPDEDFQGVRVQLVHPDAKVVGVTAPKRYRSEVAAEPRRPPNTGACATDASGVALTDEQIAWTFRKLDKNKNGYLEHDEVRSYFVRTDPERFEDAVVDRQMARVVGGRRRPLDMEDFKAVLLEIAKR